MTRRELMTWVDVEQRLQELHRSGDWPSALRWVEAYWMSLRLHVASAEGEREVLRWLATEEVFAQRVDAQNNELRLDSGIRLPLRVEVSEDPEASPPAARYIPSFARPLHLPAPSPLSNESDDDFYDPPIVAFHSYKGGVGRTTHALAFALEAVSQTKQKVLLIDGDFEAPGLSWHIRDRYPEPAVSYADLLVLAHGDEDPAAKTSVKIVADRLANQEDHGIYVLPSFRDDFRWETLDIRPDQLVAGRSAFAISELLVSLGAKLGVSAIIIDLRAGLSELSAGILLDPRVFRVLVTSMSEQSLLGIERVAKHLSHDLGPRSSSTTHFVISHVPAELRESDRLVRARESLSAAVLVQPESGDEDSSLSSEGDLPEIVVSGYELDLVTLPLEWNSTLETLRKAGLSERLRVILERSPIVGEHAQPEPDSLPITITKAREELAARAEQQIFAERGEAAGFLRIDPLTRLALDHRTKLPLVVIAGAKGAGKTYTFFQLVLARTWPSFVAQASDQPTSESDIDGPMIVPLVSPRQIDETARNRLEELEDELDRQFGDGRVDTYTLSERIRDEVESGSEKVSQWRDLWLDVMAWRLGCQPNVAGAGQQLPQFLNTDGARQVVFVVDGLEDLFGDFMDNTSECMALRALLQNVPERLTHTFGNQVGLIVLIRPDLVRPAIPQNTLQFLDRYKNYALRWSHDAALKLAIWLAVQAQVLHLDDGASAVAALPEPQRDALLEQLWGKKLGGARSREARSTAWVTGALSDFQGQIQARDVVRMVHHAAKRSIDEDARFEDRILDPRAMRKALEDWGKEKVEELKEEDKRLAGIFSKIEAAPPGNKQIPFKAKKLNLDESSLEYLRSRGIAFDDSGDIYITELVRHGLGFTMGNGARPRIVSLRRKILRDS
ncbi:ParA family protein [Pseudenhygromyxa sp. WMMC2535]|uniref:ParA family protein n=1 Tax=Pseudenhygromyxa sp. WMMC2535 TaxID=2712867 RepID=UPI0015529910|nr:ParA family protein [Pseudenhygromyxa sp. WMMC2535]NVB42765.1 ParA family protein [Pseudenhygromyxa sp. WMMC2535]